MQLRNLPAVRASDCGTATTAAASDGGRLSTDGSSSCASTAVAGEYGAFATSLPGQRTQELLPPSGGGQPQAAPELKSPGAAAALGLARAASNHDHDQALVDMLLMQVISNDDWWLPLGLWHNWTLASRSFQHTCRCSRLPSSQQPGRPADRLTQMVLPAGFPSLQVEQLMHEKGALQGEVLRLRHDNDTLQVRVGEGRRSQTRLSTGPGSPQHTAQPDTLG